jgi:hypothetical protein
VPTSISTALGGWSRGLTAPPVSAFPSTVALSKPEGLARGRGKGLATGLPLFGTADIKVQSDEQASPAERRKAATLEYNAAKKVQAAKVKEEERARAAAAPAFRRAAPSLEGLSMAEMHMRYEAQLTPILKGECRDACIKAVRAPIDLQKLAALTAALMREALRPPEPTRVMIPGMENYLNQHLKPYSKAMNDLIDFSGHLQTMVDTSLTAFKGSQNVEARLQSILAPLPIWQEAVAAQLDRIEDRQRDVIAR